MGIVFIGCWIQLQSIGSVYHFETESCKKRKSRETSFISKKNICLQIYNWVPEFYDDITDLPEEMPKDLVDYIKALPESQVRDKIKRE